MQEKELETLWVGSEIIWLIIASSKWIGSVLLVVIISFFHQFVTLALKSLVTRKNNGFLAKLSNRVCSNLS